MKNNFISKLLRVAAPAVIVLGYSVSAPAQVVVPGTGMEIETVGDDFEDPAWTFDLQLPKTYNQLESTLSKNEPHGWSANRRWHEGIKRGQPDLIQRVETPPGGLSGSTGALALRSLTTGGPGPSNQQQQDDFIANITDVFGKIPVGQSPGVVTRVWMPPLEQWENRSGCHFAFRFSLETAGSTISTGGRFGRRTVSSEDNLFWPGMFLNREFVPAGPNGQAAIERVYFWMKATDTGHRLDGPEVTQFGWWTLGMSLSPDGKVHYFAKPGVEDLTADDLIASSYPFGRHAQTFHTFFFNVCNGDDGRTWSTEFVIDDPKVFVKQ